MNDLRVFQNEEFGQVRTILRDGEPWFVGKDVAAALGYSNASKAVSVHVDDEDKTMEMIAHSQNGNVVTQTVLINESGLYSLVLSSKLPTAKKFKRWVTSEVLPSIRRTGTYSTDGLTLADRTKIAQILSKTPTSRIQYVLDVLRPIPNLFETPQTAHTAPFTQADPREGLIREFVERRVPIGWEKKTLLERRLYWLNGYGRDTGETVERDRICALEVWCECLGGDANSMKKSDAREINSILSGLHGWAKHPKTARYGWCEQQNGGYFRSKNG